MVSAARKRPGISGGSSSASVCASAGDFKRKLRVKWFWLIVCSSLVCGFLDCFCSGMLLLRRHLRGAEFEGQLVDCPSEAERQFIAVIHPRTSITPDVHRFVDGHHKRNRVRDRLFG